jgi:hypothetical protein
LSASASDTVTNDDDDNVKQMGRQLRAMNLSQHIYVRLTICQQPITYLILFIPCIASVIIHLYQYIHIPEIKSYLYLIAETCSTVQNYV